MYKVNDDLESFNKLKNKKKITEENNLKRDFMREHITSINNTITIESKKETSVLAIRNKITYIDKTDEWLNNKIETKITVDNYFIDDKGIKHPIFGKENVILPKKDSDEMYVAKILSRDIGGDIHLVPQITDASNSGISTRTPDYRRNGLKWDLKTPKYKEDYTNLLNDIFRDTNLRKQSERFVVNFTNYKNINDDEIDKMCRRMFGNKYRHWIKGIILIKGAKIYKIFIQK